MFTVLFPKTASAIADALVPYPDARAFLFASLITYAEDEEADLADDGIPQSVEGLEDLARCVISRLIADLLAPNRVGMPEYIPTLADEAGNAIAALLDVYTSKLLYDVLRIIYADLKDQLDDLGDDFGLDAEEETRFMTGEMDTINAVMGCIARTFPAVIPNE